MTVHGNIPLGLMLNTTDRTVLPTYEYGCQTSFDEPWLNDDYSKLLKDIRFCASNEYGSLTLKQLKFALHDNQIEVITDYEFSGSFHHSVLELTLYYLGEIMPLVNQCLNENEVDFPESMVSYKDGFYIPFKMGEQEKEIKWYRVQVLGAGYPHDVLELYKLLP